MAVLVVARRRPRVAAAPGVRRVPDGLRAGDHQRHAARRAAHPAPAGHRPGRADRRGHLRPRARRRSRPPAGWSTHGLRWPAIAAVLAAVAPTCHPPAPAGDGSAERDHHAGVGVGLLLRLTSAPILLRNRVTLTMTPYLALIFARICSKSAPSVTGRPCRRRRGGGGDLAAAVARLHGDLRVVAQPLGLAGRRRRPEAERPSSSGRQPHRRGHRGAVALERGERDVLARRRGRIELISRRGVDRGDRAEGVLDGLGDVEREVVAEPIGVDQHADGQPVDETGGHAGRRQAEHVGRGDAADHLDRLESTPAARLMSQPCSNGSCVHVGVTSRSCSANHSDHSRISDWRAMTIRVYSPRSSGGRRAEQVGAGTGWRRRDRIGPIIGGIVLEVGDDELRTTCRTPRRGAAAASSTTS